MYSNLIYVKKSIGLEEDSGSPKVKLGIWSIRLEDMILVAIPTKKWERKRILIDWVSFFVQKFGCIWLVVYYCDREMKKNITFIKNWII